MQTCTTTNGNTPNLLARAQRNASTEDNIKSRSRAAGIVHITPTQFWRVLSNLSPPSLKTPHLSFSWIWSSLWYISKHQNQVLWMSYKLMTAQTGPAKPRPPLTASTSYWRRASYHCFLQPSQHQTVRSHAKTTSCCMTSVVEMQVARAGEWHLREDGEGAQVKQDKRKLSSGSAVIFEWGSVLIVEKLARGAEDGILETHSKIVYWHSRREESARYLKSCWLHSWEGELWGYGLHAICHEILSCT